MDNGANYYRRYLDGEDDGLVELVTEYKDGLMLYLNSYVRNIHLAEELTEETFFRLISRKPKFSGKSTFQSWLYGIGRNIALDHVRRSARHKHTSFDQSDLERCVKEETDLETAYLKEEQKLLLYQALSKLNAEYRAVLWLIYMEDFSNKEAAVVLKKSDRQMRNLLYRAKQSLKAILEKEGFENEK